MKKVIVASKNPVKLKAVQRGFQKMFPEETFSFECVQSASNVADQPMSDQESLQGALNRTQSAKKQCPNADFYIGLEGGLEKRDDSILAFAWAVVVSTENKIGKGRTGSFFLPPQVVKLINEGYELGEADDIIFKKKKFKTTKWCCRNIDKQRDRSCNKLSYSRHIRAHPLQKPRTLLKLNKYKTVCGVAQPARAADC